jgi:hypothetical protein
VNAPIRAFRPRLLPQPAEDAHARLTADAETAVVAATAQALTSCTALLRRWGLVVHTLPTVTVGPPPSGGIGAVEVRWRGREADTGWPAMTGWLLVTPAGPDDSLLALHTTRPATTGLQVPAWTSLHRERAADLLVDRFLGALADQLGRTTVTGPARPRSTEVVR